MLGRSYAAAVTSEPNANTTREATRTGTRPRRSAILPISGSTATYPSRKPDTIGAARWSSSTARPTLVIMSGRASRTTWGPAPRNPTATDATVSSSRLLTLGRRSCSARGSRGWRRDLPLDAVVVEADRVRDVADARVERPGQHGLRQLVLVVDSEPRVEVPARGRARDDRGHRRARNGRGVGALHDLALPDLVALLDVSRGGEQ